MKVLDRGSFLSLFYRWCPSLKEMTQGPNQIPSAVVLSQKCPFHGNFGNFFHWYLCRNRYTVCVEFENVMKSTHTKKKLPMKIPFLFCRPFYFRTLFSENFFRFGTNFHWSMTFVSWESKTGVRDLLK